MSHLDKGSFIDLILGKKSLRWTANKLLKGAGAGAGPTEIDVPLAFTELFGTQVIHTATGGTWADWDLSAIIGAGAKSALIHVSCEVSSTGLAGIRKNGSALVRYIDGTLGGEDGCAVLTEVDANRVVETYGKSNTVGYRSLFRVLGYWS